MIETMNLVEMHCVYFPGEVLSVVIWQIDWPTSLPTSEESFVKSVLREKKTALEELMLKRPILQFSKGVSASLDEQLAKEARRAASSEKQRIAEEVASLLRVSVNIDTTSSKSLEKTVAALRAGAAIAEVPVYFCFLIAGSKSGLAAAEQIRMPRVVLRSSYTSRAEFPTANAIMDGFGGADLTISKLCQKRWS
ncbi:Haloacid dehalogenase-like hydrolase (HAD) superfamily protein isoform 2 [Hibiscus syriacus]|uniref:Haloacid dehalogenase-like hydrolase (HAD) superfamily protein isoform 2 n=1 Tax=Hibiscus syriacus TaxID=106335 RepID=A0A6A3BST2_HIBSY|nr:Haloacid dehalogenase-like hydrolase (HAD) superfamily protein isoform 2 [Hibiscus syriacus]